MNQCSDQEVEAKVAQCAALLGGAHRLLVITGAGISAESGIQTYRGPGGLFEDSPDTQSMLSKEGLARDPDRIWSHFNELRTLVAESQPNTTHRILAQTDRGSLSFSH